MHLASWNSVSRTYCRILCKPDGKQHYCWYPWVWDLPWQSTFSTGARYSAFHCLPSWVIVNWHRTSERNWLRTIIVTTKNTHNHVRVFRVVFGDIMLSCETWLVLHAKERWGTSNLTGNGCEQWTTTDLVHCHPFWLAAVRVGMFWQLISHLYIREMETEWEKDCLKPIIKTHPVIQIWSFLLILNG